MPLITLEKHDNTYYLLTLYTNTWPPPTKVKSSLIWRFIMFCLTITFSNAFSACLYLSLCLIYPTSPTFLLGFCSSLHMSNSETIPINLTFFILSTTNITLSSSRIISFSISSLLPPNSYVMYISKK